MHWEVGTRASAGRRYRTLPTTRHSARSAACLFNGSVRRQVICRVKPPATSGKVIALSTSAGLVRPSVVWQAQVVSVDSEAVYLVDPRCPADTPSARSTRRYPVCRLCANTQRLLEPACLCRFRYACPPQVAHTFGSTATQQDLHDGAGAEASPTFHFLSLTQHTCQQRAAHTTADWHTASHPCTRAPKHAATPKN